MGRKKYIQFYTDFFFAYLNPSSVMSGLNQYLAVDKVSCSRTQHSDSAGGEVQTLWSQSISLPTEPLNSLGYMPDPSLLDNVIKTQISTCTGSLVNRRSTK